MNNTRKGWTAKLSGQTGDKITAKELKTLVPKEKKDYGYKPEYINALKLRFVYDAEIRVLTLYIKGRFPSLNVFYESPHWDDRKKIVDAFHHRLAATMFYLENATGKVPPFERVRAEIEYNSNLDVDNVILTSKFTLDFIRFAKIIKDDRKKFYRGLSIIPNEELEKNQYIVRLISVPAELIHKP